MQALIFTESVTTSTRLDALDLSLDGFVLKGPRGSRWLTSAERRLLFALGGECTDDVVDDALLLEKVWGPGYRENAELLQFYVGRLREIFREVGLETGLIQSPDGRGHCLVL